MVFKCKLENEFRSEILMDSIWYVVFGGAIGTVSRYWATLILAAWLGDSFPFGTVFVNLVGSFLIGLLAGLPMGFSTLPQPMRLLLVIGFLGGFTTFSSYSFNTFQLLQQGAWFKAGLNAFGSVFVGIIALYLGYFLMHYTYASMGKG